MSELPNFRSYKPHQLDLSRSALVTGTNVDTVLESVHTDILHIVSLIDEVDGGLTRRDFGDREVQLHHMPVRSASSLRNPKLMSAIVGKVSRLVESGEHVHIHCLMGETRT